MTKLEIEQLRKDALKAISPLCPADTSKYFWGKRTTAGRELPPYYIVYFLLADLLGFSVLGKEEKVAWSIVLELEDTTFVIEHRKMGLGIFVQDPVAGEIQARKVLDLITRGARVSEKYFDSLAEAAIRNSKLNLLNKSKYLYNRLEYFLSLYKKAKQEAELRKEESILETLPDGTYQARHPSRYDFERQADWLAITAIEAFFSWTEHVFIHLALLSGSIITGADTASLAEADWPEKFKKALDLGDTNVKKFYDELILIRRQLRNYIAHGAFGKRGEAFRFHSKAGAVPVLMPHNGRNVRFSMQGDLSFREETALSVIEEFIKFLHTGKQSVVFKYVQESELPTVLTYVANGKYKRATTSMGAMNALIYEMQEQFDRSANMEW